MEPLLKAIKETSKVPLWKEKILVIFLIITFLLNLFLWFFVYLNYKSLKEITILHYSVLTGVDRIDKKIYLFEVPFIGLIIFLLNLVLTIFLYQKGKTLLGYFLVSSSFLVNIILTTAAILIMTL